MPGVSLEGRRGAGLVQAKAGGWLAAGVGAWAGGRAKVSGAAGRLVLGAAFLLAGCSDPLGGPVDLFHDLQGGEIAAQRPPPPGAGLPYPKLASVPGKPVLPAPAFRNGLAAQLLAERDRTERVAADTPLAVVPPVPGAAAAVPAAGAGAPVAAASLDTAEAGPPAAKGGAPAAVAAGPAVGAGVTLAGAPADAAGAPSMPDAPPAPASFEGVLAEPAPTPRILPAGTAMPAGTQVFFADGSAVLAASQTQALKDFLSHRRRQGIEVVGLGSAASDTPDGQAAAVELALRRARAVAAALEAQHVPGRSDTAERKCVWARRGITAFAIGSAVGRIEPRQGAKVFCFFFSKKKAFLPFA